MNGMSTNVNNVRARPQKREYSGNVRLQVHGLHDVKKEGTSSGVAGQ